MDIINYSKRLAIFLLLSISSNKNRGTLYQEIKLWNCFTKNLLEACPNNLAPTSSTTIMLVIGDAIAVSL